MERKPSAEAAVPVSPSPGKSRAHACTFAPPAAALPFAAKVTVGGAPSRWPPSFAAASAAFVRAEIMVRPREASTSA